MELTTKRKKAIFGGCLAAVVIIAVVIVGIILNQNEKEGETEDFVEVVEVIDLEGYDTYDEWVVAIEEKHQNYNGKTDEVIALYVVDDEQATRLRELEELMVNSGTIKEFEEYEAEFAALVADIEANQPVEEVVYTTTYYEPTYTYTNTSGLTPASGVNYYNGRKETYYSSNVLYHYRTPEWDLGEDGVYRENGYVVVAASDLPQGSIVDTSFGPGIVRDTGCAPGVTDIYCAW